MGIGRGDGGGEIGSGRGLAVSGAVWPGGWPTPVGCNGSGNAIGSLSPHLGSSGQQEKT